MGAPILEEPFTNKFTKKKEIARGLRGVIRCVEDDKGAKFAAKTIRKTQKGQNIVDEIEMEMRALNVCEGVSTVVNLHAVYMTSRDYTFILDYLPSDLHSEVEKSGPMKEAEVAQIIRDLLKTLKFLHDRQIVHLDLKPENILIDEERKIYLCDFGMSKVLQNEKETCRVAGTTEYCSPEQIQFEPLSTASDMWSVGVIAYVLLSKISPFNPAQDGQEKHETQNAVINCTYDFDDSSWSSRSAESKSFIQTLLIRAPQKRASVDEALSHPWIAEKENGVEMAAPPKIIRRLSKRSSSLALLGDQNLNVSDSSGKASDAAQEILAAIGELPSKKIKSDSQD